MSDEQPTRVPVPGRSRGGSWVVLGDEEYRVPALGLLAVQELGEDIQGLKDIKGIPTAAQMRVVVRIAHAALRRNYPEMTEDEVADMLDMGNFQRVLGEVLNISGFVRDAAGEKGAT